MMAEETKRTNWCALCVLFAIAGMLLLVGIAASRRAASEELLLSRAIRVIDGDTIAYGHEPIRLIGLDAPEIHANGYRCEAELALGLRAKAGLLDLVRPPHRVTLRRSHDRWGEVRRDRYGRALARLYSDGRNVAPLLIGAGLAHPYNGRGPRAPWC